jgi:hypothetical protein
MNARLEPRAEGCLSDLAIDVLLAGDASPDDAEAARSHAASCETCKARLAALTKEKEAFAAPLVVPRPARAARARRFQTVAFGASALALAAALFLVVRSKPRPDTPGETTRSKGSSHIGFYVKHGGAVTLGAPGQIVAPGDALRFVYSTGEAKHLAVLSLDGARHASVYYPSGGAAERIEPGRDQALPRSTILDATLGKETLYGLFCDAPVTLEPLRADLEATGMVPSPPGCEVDAVEIEKRGSLPEP